MFIVSNLNLLWCNSRPLTLNLLLLPGAEADPHLTTTSFQAVVEREGERLSPESPPDFISLRDSAVQGFTQRL